jgi:hypothetical protein
LGRDGRLETKILERIEKQIQMTKTQNTKLITNHESRKIADKRV